MNKSKVTKQLEQLIEVVKDENNYIDIDVEYIEYKNVDLEDE